jgi:hypothetical protein
MRLMMRSVMYLGNDGKMAHKAATYEAVRGEESVAMSPWGGDKREASFTHSTFSPVFLCLLRVLDRHIRGKDGSEGWPYMARTSGQPCLHQEPLLNRSRRGPNSIPDLYIQRIWAWG